MYLHKKGKQARPEGLHETNSQKVGTKYASMQIYA
jgi:hypothetical protein